MVGTGTWILPLGPSSGGPLPQHDPSQPQPPWHPPYGQPPYGQQPPNQPPAGWASPPER